MIAIHSKRVIINDTIKDATIFIKDGIISDIEEGLVTITDNLLTDVGDSILMPGITDPHVHINEPGRTSWEGFETATRAAIAGGITTLVDMPLNALPVLTSVDAFNKKREATENKLYTDCAFWGGIVPGNLNAIEPLIEKGVLGFKVFLTHSGIDDFPNVTETDLRQAMPILAKHNMPLLVHCELATNNNFSSENPLSNTYKYYLESRPKSWEDNAIELMIKLCREYNCKTHIVHLSSANSIKQLADAKAEGLPLTVETGQHYLFFNAEEINDGQTQFKCAPPIREKQNNDLLWKALQEGIIDFVATDHSPAPAEMKNLKKGNFLDAWGGISSLQFALPVLWTAALKRNIDVSNIAKWLCEKPNFITGMQNKKGIIKKGITADFAIWNPEESFIVKEESILHKHKLTPYLNKELSGVVQQTFLRGKKVYDHGIFSNAQGNFITA